MHILIAVVSVALIFPAVREGSNESEVTARLCHG